MRHHDTASLSDDIESLKGIGHGAVALINTAILLAIVAVIVASKATPGVVQGFFAALAWLVQQAVSPLSGGANTVLSSQLLPAGAYPMTAGGSLGGTGTGSTGGAGTTGTDGTVFTTGQYTDDSIWDLPDPATGFTTMTIRPDGSVSTSNSPLPGADLAK
jgi:hypothetical protein